MSGVQAGDVVWVSVDGWLRMGGVLEIRDDGDALVESMSAGGVRKDWLPMHGLTKLYHEGVWN